MRHALDRDKQLGVVRQFTEIVARSAGDAALADRTWVLLTDAPDGGWGLNGHAHTNDELITAARKAMLAKRASRRPEKQKAPRLRGFPSSTSRRPDSNRGPLHYE